jgi:hypothetical protein
MPETIRAQAQSHPNLPHVSLNSDGHRHPMLNVMTAVTFIAGVAALVCGAIVSLHLPATVIGLVGFAVGLYAQMLSATREERILIVAGLIAAFVGMGLGIAHGGFS